MGSEEEEVDNVQAPQSMSSAARGSSGEKTSPCENEGTCIYGGRVSEAGGLCSGCIVGTLATYYAGEGGALTFQD